MTINKIESKCPRCNGTTADVLGLIASEKKVIVVVKCIPKHHQYTLDSEDKNTRWKRFFNK